MGGSWPYGWNRSVVHVDLVEELGSDSIVYGTVALEGHIERFVVRVDSQHTPRLGEIVYVKPRAGATTPSTP